MRRFLLLPLLLLSLALGGCRSARTGYFPPPVGNITPPAGSVQPTEFPWLLHIRGTTGGGTAFATTYRGSLGIMTAWHVVARGNHNGQVIGAGVRVNFTFRQVEGADVAWAPAAQLPATWEVLKMNQRDPSVGDIVEAWGYPGQDSMGTKGPILNIDSVHDDTAMLAGKYLEVDAEVRPGMSGGPVLNSRKEVVAVVALVKVMRILHIDENKNPIGLETLYRHYPARIP